MNKGEKMKAPTKDDIRERLLTYKNKLKQAEYEIERLNSELKALNNHIEHLESNYI